MMNLRPQRSRDRSLKVRELCDRENRRYREAIAAIHNMEDIVDFARSSIPQVVALEENLKRENDFYCRDVCGAFFSRWTQSRRLELKIKNVPYPEVIEWIAGPIHRMYGVDWRMEVGSDRITLATIIKPNGYGRGINFEIDLYQGNVISLQCKIVQTHTTHTEYDSDVYEMNCK